MVHFSGCGIVAGENLPAAKLFWYRQRLLALSANLNRGFFSRINNASLTPRLGSLREWWPTMRERRSIRRPIYCRSSPGPWESRPTSCWDWKRERETDGPGTPGSGEDSVRWKNSHPRDVSPSCSSSTPSSEEKRGDSRA